MIQAGIVLFWVAKAAWSFDPGSEARRLMDSEPPAPVQAEVPLAADPARPDPEPPSSRDEARGRIVRVVLREGEKKVKVDFRGAWTDASGRPTAGSVEFGLGADGIVRSGEGQIPDRGAATLAFEPSVGASFCLAARCYRGAVRLEKTASGIAVVDHVALEDYLLGVVPGEIGRRLDPRFAEAVKAQAVVARTYTLRSLGQYAGKPWDLRDDVRDQVYEGLKGEDTLCSRSVRSTRGQILADEKGRPVDAYYHSTSGGHTADIAEVWPHKAGLPYLKGVVDTAPDGRSWGGAVPVAAWTERWPIQQLHDSVRRDLTEALGRKVDPGKVAGLRLEGRDSSGRARKLVVTAEKGVFEVPGDRIRWALRRPAKGRPILRSSRFELEVVNGEYLAEGTGNGHGVGMSQNGAMGRAHAGQTYKQILSAYYPGTVLRTIDP